MRDRFLSSILETLEKELQQKLSITLSLNDQFVIKNFIKVVFKFGKAAGKNEGISETMRKLNLNKIMPY